MNERIKRLSSKKELQDKVEDYMFQGYEIEDEFDDRAVLVNKTYGSLLGHILVFIFTAWFTFGLGNLIYLAYALKKQSKRITFKVSEDE